MHENCCEDREAFSLRSAVKDDCLFLFELRNEKEVRENSFHTEPVVYEAHQKWFEKKSADHNTEIFIFEQSGNRIGQVRVDRAGNKADISYALCKEARGKGYSCRMLSELEKWVRTHRWCRRLTAEVKRNNIASRKIFLSLGYAERETDYGYCCEKQIF